MDVATIIATLLSNFDLVMFIVAIFFIVIQRLLVGTVLPFVEISYRWLAFFALGCTGLYASLMHAVFPAMTAANIGWAESPFQFEVAMANLAFGVLGIASRQASYAFRLATVVGATCWLWGDAVGHLYQLMKYQNVSIGNAGSWLWVDLLLPLCLIVCMSKLNVLRRRMYV